MICEANELLEKDNLGIIERKIIYIYIWSCLENPSISYITRISFMNNNFLINYNTKSDRIKDGGFSINIELYKENEIIISGHSYNTRNPRRYREVINLQTDSTEGYVKDLISYLVETFISEYDTLLK